MKRPVILSLIILLSATVAFTLHALLFRSWLIDDAGISLAYARNLAHGYGLTAQPGVPPVEGFSNPLWTLLLAASAATGVFDVLWTPKLLSWALVAGAFVVILKASPRPRLLAALPLMLLSCNTSFVVWTTSGLENGLLAFLVVLSCGLSIRAAEGERASWALDGGSGLVAGLLALTRPDALLYAAAYPLTVLALARPPIAWRPLSRRLVRYGITLCTVFGAYLAFRVSYYGDWVPNTYHAKDKPSLLSLVDFAKIGDLLGSVAGPMAGAFCFLFVAGALWPWLSARMSGRLRVLLLYLGLATVAYLVLPLDWMGEYRFATAFFVFLYWSVGEMLQALVEAEWPRPRRQWAIAGFAVVLLSLTGFIYGPRSRAFAENPVVPFQRVAAFNGAGYNRLAAILGLSQASLLTPDLGGTLYYSTLRVYDLAGLCDRVVALTLRNDHEAFLDYVFERTRPTFIHAHASWAEWAAFPDDPRLARDYVPISERWDGPPEWRAHASLRLPWSADYVRRDAVGPHPEKLTDLRRAFLEQGMPALSP
ncbi:MAG TPA: hypothetical protein VMV21_20165 [Vicinamibacteria bacterium]|nr:hypothetical protein [Vicinamibacteria bacterium]